MTDNDKTHTLDVELMDPHEETTVELTWKLRAAAQLYGCRDVGYQQPTVGGMFKPYRFTGRLLDLIEVARVWVEDQTGDGGDLDRAQNWEQVELRDSVSGEFLHLTGANPLAGANFVQPLCQVEFIGAIELEDAITEQLLPEVRQEVEKALKEAMERLSLRLQPLGATINVDYDC